MKQLFFLLIFFIPVLAFSQMLMKPGNPSIEYQRISDEKSNMIWYLIQDTTKIEIGRVTHDIRTDSLNLTVVTTVKMRQSPAPWIDSTVADRNSLKPVYHSSYNTQRDMILRFDSLITGYYADKEKNATIPIYDRRSMDYFDSNLYPTIIRWLPLKTGFTRDLSIYDFNPKGKTGVMKVSVIAVRQCDYLYQDKEVRRVYLVTVRDDISSGTTTYFIDVETRKLWKMVIASGEHKMMMEAV
ncbi:MAG: hypothetical protein EOO04_18330 [Chitinophagaceae bacterium]|nr:MAG: hypothetical protein EOO04_18330 [Chitinophagaceae bacterium]